MVKGIMEEINSLRNQNTWHTIPNYNAGQLLHTKFMSKVKSDEEGCTTRHKAIIVVKVYLKGDVDENYSPVVYFTSIKTGIAFAEQRKMNYLTWMSKRLLYI